MHISSGTPVLGGDFHLRGVNFERFGLARVFWAKSQNCKSLGSLLGLHGRKQGKLNDLFSIFGIFRVHKSFSYAQLGLLQG